MGGGRDTERQESDGKEVVEGGGGRAVYHLNTK